MKRKYKRRTSRFEMCIRDRLIGLEPRVAIPESETIIAGDCFICRHDRRGNFQSIREEDIPLIESKVQYITEEMLLRLALLKYFGML